MVRVVSLKTARQCWPVRMERLVVSVVMEPRVFLRSSTTVSPKANPPIGARSLGLHY